MDKSQTEITPFNELTPEEEHKIPVIIMCGGKGTRMREETEFRPKVIVPIGNEPIVWHVMKIYGHYHFKHFILCLGYKGDMIKEHFKDLAWRANDFRLKTLTNHLDILKDDGIDRGEDWDIIFAETGLESNTARRLKLVEKYVNTDIFMLTYGDGVGNVNIEKLIEYHRKGDSLITITGIHPNSRFGVLKIEGDRILSFKEKAPLSDYINAGFMVMNREVFNLLPPIEENHTLEEFLTEMAKQRQIRIFPHEGFWDCMDTYKDFEYLNALWQKNPPWKIWKDADEV
ncbi:glucose-1-phosphate cytidylyltransferase [Candidatus Uhrbacteria bacterium CG_4_9_14_3_um_filter_36_7]|uniref:Glucose-1-phosphate cytidylyltransferase n=1 Tax=Candidatus Uhrbacteria bacterium CG_4_9_14_3_um_filter_36_7 TaxID=1975033 RepID=A0A2M7XI48_9BACT|nr:MAG: glucose-1-phosphate cytidylyltransferase [Candidatus Uhrbacteria bacterium CG_4_9_14_3_um_filter_36_7]